MVETSELKQKTDWLVPTAVVLGGAGIAAGLYFYMKKPPGVDPGGSFDVTFNFDYLGEGGIFVLQVHLGKLYVGSIFDHVEGLGWSKQVTLAGPDSYEFKINCILPMATDPKIYDGEAGIRAVGPWDPPYDYIAGPVYKNGAVEVRK